ncbi:MAG: hypothetical protein CR958_00590 [Rhodobacterales bacterium]|nr:MAG: hypothetical protein CR958_00590 [Rhodobacterales bacterium]
MNMSRSLVDHHAATGKIFLTDHVIHFATPRDPLQALPPPACAPAGLAKGWAWVGRGRFRRVKSAGKKLKTCKNITVTMGFSVPKC